MCRRWLLCLLLILSSFCSVAASQSTLTANEYKALINIHKLVELQQWAKAHQALKQANKALKRPYPQALRLQTLGQVYLAEEHYPQALDALTAAYKLEALPKNQQLDLLYLRAQLLLNQQRWRQGSEALEAWLRAMRVANAKKITAQVYLWLAQAYSQQNDWKKSVQSIQKAISMRRNPPESWYQLQLAGLLNLQHWSSAIDVLSILIVLQPDSERYWQQKASLQLQKGWSSQALATLRLAYLRGVLSKPGNQKLFVQLLLQQQMPFQAAQVLQNAFAGNTLPRSSEHLALLSNALLQAKEQKSALAILQQQAKQKASVELLTRIAQVQLSLQQYGNAEQTISRALALKPKRPERLLVLQGMSRIELDKLTEAKQSFELAGQHKQTEQMSLRWLDYLKQLDQAS